MALAQVQDILTGFPGLATLEPSWGSQISTQGDGNTIVKQIRDPLWLLHAETKMLEPGELRQWRGILNSLANGGNLFYGRDMISMYPYSYPKGIGFASPLGSPVINAIGSQAITISGLTAGFRGTVGDFFQVNWGSSPFSIALLQAAESFVCNGSGLSPSFAVNGAIPAGMTTGNAVTIINPSCHMRLLPGSLKFPSDKTAWGIITFDAIQVPEL